jgi:hypothetical protein
MEGRTHIPSPVIRGRLGRGRATERDFEDFRSEISGHLD